MLFRSPEAVFRLKRNAELSYHDHVQRGVEFLGYLERHRHAAARQAEHDRAAAAQEPEVGRELPPRVRPVCEVHGVPQNQYGGISPWAGNTARWVAMIAWSIGSPGSKPDSNAT